MFLRFVFRLFVLLAVLGISVAAAAQEEQKRDRFGDPLPEGAIARLGSLRLRNDLPILAAAFTSSGKTLAACDVNSISFWDTTTGKSVRRVELKNANQARLRHLCGDGETLLLSGFDNVLHTVSIASGAESHTLKLAQAGYFQGLDASRDGKIVAAAYQTAIALWDVPAQKLLHELKGPQFAAATNNRLMALTPDGKQLIVTHPDQSLHLIDVASGKEIRALEMPPARPGFPPALRLQKIAVSPDGRYLAFGGPNIPICIGELSTGKRVRELPPPQVVLSGLAFSPNSRFIAVDEYNRLRLFGVQSGKELRNLAMKPGANNLLAFSPDGRILATCRGGYSIHLWDLAAERQMHPSVGHEAAVQSMVFFPDGKRLVSADFNRGMILWDIPSGRNVIQRTNNTPTISLSVEEDGESVRFGGYDAALHRWYPLTGREERQPLDGRLVTNVLAFSPDGRSMARMDFPSSGKTPNLRQLRLYDLKTNKSIELSGLHSAAWVLHLMFAPDSRRLAACSNDGALRLWDRDTGKLVREFKPETRGPQPNALSFAADGRSIAFFDGMIRIREIASGADRVQIAAIRSLTTLVCSPDARFLACGQHDGSIVVFGAVSGKELARWQAKQGLVQAFTFSRDSRLLASGGANGTILIWKVPQMDSLPAVLKEDEAVAMWEALSQSDAAAASRALAALVDAPERTLPLFKERLRPLGNPLDRERLARWIAELDDDSFKVRESATRKLALAGSEAGDVLRQALQNHPSAETKRRIENLLSRLKGGDPERLRFLRAIEVLERIGSARAKEMLRDLAAKPQADDLREEVQASLRRLNENEKQTKPNRDR